LSSERVLLIDLILGGEEWFIRYLSAVVGMIEGVGVLEECVNGSISKASIVIIIRGLVHRTILLRYTHRLNTTIVIHVMIIITTSITIIVTILLRALSPNTCSHDSLYHILGGFSTL
jgi:hypothetical protein